MKITIKLLKSINAHSDFIYRYKNTPELHNIDIDKITEITVSDEFLCNDIRWLINKLSNKLLIKKVSLKKIDCGLNETIYDKNGNILIEKKSDDTNGNIVFHKNSYGFGVKYLYDENGNLLMYKNSNGYHEKRTYDDNGKLLTVKYKDLNNFWKEKKYNENETLSTSENFNSINHTDYSKLKYDLTVFEIY